ncbi:MAG: transposase [Gammaproteobacteria bacterium]|nr:MAG: transposase [Gammaproteobacteria bacterium]
MRYRRADTLGGTYFFTVNLAERNKTLLVDEIDVLRASINKVKKQHPFKLDAMVVMPEHLHAILTLPHNDNDFATRWMLIKAGFSRHIPKQESISDSRLSRGERGIWQRRYWEHLIRDDADFSAHVDYIHFNPVKHGHVARAVDWPYSSVHHYVKQGLLNESWACEAECLGGFGEPHDS